MPTSLPTAVEISHSALWQVESSSSSSSILFGFPTTRAKMNYLRKNTHQTTSSIGSSNGRVYLKT